MKYLWGIFTSCIGGAVWLLTGALVYLWVFGDPDFYRLATWGVMVFWPFVLLWYAMIWGICLAVVISVIVIVYLKFEDWLEIRSIRRDIAKRRAQRGA